MWTWSSLFRRFTVTYLSSYSGSRSSPVTFSAVRSSQYQLFDNWRLSEDGSRNRSAGGGRFQVLGPVEMKAALDTVDVPVPLDCG